MTTSRVYRCSAVLLIAVAGCGELNDLPTDPDGGPPDPSATLTRVQNEIFTPTCSGSGCHGTVGTQQGLILTEGRSHAMLVGQPSTQVPSLNRVTPGNPLDSYLYRKVTGGAVVGERMPLGGQPLSTEHIALLRDWIRRGAPDD